MSRACGHQSRGLKPNSMRAAGVSRTCGNSAARSNGRVAIRSCSTSVSPSRCTAANAWPSSSQNADSGAMPAGCEPERASSASAKAGAGFCVSAPAPRRYGCAPASSYAWRSARRPLPAVTAPPVARSHRSWISADRSRTPGTCGSRLRARQDTGPWRYPNVAPGHARIAASTSVRRRLGATDRHRRHSHHNAEVPKKKPPSRAVFLGARLQHVLSRGHRANGTRRVPERCRRPSAQ